MCYNITAWHILTTHNEYSSTVPHQVIPQYENVDMNINTLPTIELEMNSCTAYSVIKY